MTKQSILDRKKETSHSSALPPLRWVGYGLLALVLFDWVELFMPMQLMNPAWELQTLGQLVEKVPVLLVGSALIFWGDSTIEQRQETSGIEKFVLKYTSWLMLLIGTLYFLLIPLGLFNTSRLDRQISREASAQVEQTQKLAEQAQSHLAQIKTTTDLEGLLHQLGNVGITLPPGDAPDLESLKGQVNHAITTSVQTGQQQAQATRYQKRSELFKKSLKWNLGALVSAALFIHLWRGSAWARR
jgi:hypothetical protein